MLASDLGARGDASRRQRWRANIRAAIDELLPILAYVSFPLLVHGEYDVTPDHQPILGRVDERVYVAAGFSGHGFMIAPAVARILADAILDGGAGRGARRSRRARFARSGPCPSRSSSRRRTDDRVELDFDQHAFRDEAAHVVPSCSPARCP